MSTSKHALNLSLTPSSFWLIMRRNHPQPKRSATMLWNEKRRLYEDWQDKARGLVKDGWTRQPEYNPNIPTLFTRNGETVFLVRETPRSEWTVKVLEPLNQ